MFYGTQKDEFNYDKHHVFRSIILASKHNLLLSLKKHTHIPIPNALNLIGVVDETGVLQEGEVFVQYRQDNFACQGSSDAAALVLQERDKMTRLVEGLTIVSRSPATHPSNIRVLNAVDRRDILGHHVN